MTLSVDLFFSFRSPYSYLALSKTAKYVMRDSLRVAQRENIPFRFPRPDPIVQDMETLDVAEHQPHIHRLTRLGALAQSDGRSLEFVSAIAPVLWNGEVAGWNEGDHLAQAAAAAGFDLPAMDAAITADPQHYERVIGENEQDHAASGHWGVPTFVFEAEPFFGQDRIETLIWRMQSRGLMRRS